MDRARLPSRETPRCPLAPRRKGSWNTWMGTRCGQKQGATPALSPGDPHDRQAAAELCRVAWGVTGSGRGPGPCGYEKPQTQPAERGVVPPRLRPWHVGTRIQEHTFNVARFPGGTVVKNLPANAGNVRDPGLIPGSGRSPGGEQGNPLQYSCLEKNPMDRGA